MRLILSPRAVKSLAAMPKRDRAGLTTKIETFAANPFAPLAAARPLKGLKDAVRIRQGDWRVICRLDRDDDLVIVEAIGHRSEIYR